MKVYAVWYGGPSYAAPSVPDDLEEFSSLKSAKDAFQSRSDCDPYRPCVSESEMQIFFHHPDTNPYPNVILKLGPRGGVRVERG